VEKSEDQNREKTRESSEDGEKEILSIDGARPEEKTVWQNLESGHVRIQKKKRNKKENVRFNSFHYVQRHRTSDSSIQNRIKEKTYTGGITTKVRDIYIICGWEGTLVDRRGGILAVQREKEWERRGKIVPRPSPRNGGTRMAG